MKRWMIIWLFIIPISNLSGQKNIHELRNVYDKTVNDKALCKKMINELEHQSQSPILLAYLGAFQTIWANHTNNLITKWNTFKKGKNNIETAVSEDPNNLEIRLIRYSVQQNAPRFLSYHSNLEEDKKFIEKHRSSVVDESLLTFIKKIK